MAKSFEGAEQDISQQKMAAMEAVAQFGRRGLEEGVLAARGLKTRTDAVNQSNLDIARRFKVPEDVSNGARDLFAPYTEDQQLAQQQFQTEADVAKQSTDQYFDQAAAAIPAMRSQAGMIADQYRAAWEDRQSQVEAERQMRAEAARQFAADLAWREQEALLSAQLMRERMGHEQSLGQMRLEAERLQRPLMPPAPVMTAPAPRRSVGGFRRLNPFAR